MMVMSTREVNAVLIKAFNIDAEMFGVHVSVDGNQDNIITSFWFGLTAWRHCDQGLMVAIINTTQWKKGLLYIPDVTYFDYPQPETPTSKLAIIDLSDWNDPVSEALHDIDVFPVYDRYGYGYIIGYYLHVATITSVVRIDFPWSDKRPKMANLSSALFETIFKLGEIYNDDQIITFLMRGHPY